MQAHYNLDYPVLRLAYDQVIQDENEQHSYQ